jgi:uncharacterized membrane protein
MANKKVSNIFKTALYVSSLCGLGYFAALMFLHAIGLSLSGWIEWIFRIAIIICIMWSIMGYRMQYTPRGMGFGAAFGLGMLSAFLLGAYMALSIFIFQTAVAPDYNQKYKEFYMNKRSNQMYNTQLNNQIKEKGESYKLTASDSALVEKGLNLHSKKVSFHFTPHGSAAINLIFSLLWGIVISATVSFMARQK